MNELNKEEFSSPYLKKIEFQKESLNNIINIYPIAAGKSFHFEENPLGTINLKDYLIKNENATNLYRVVSDSLEPVVRKNDKLLIDTKLIECMTYEQLNGKLVAVIFEGESLVKRFITDNGRIYFSSDNPFYNAILVEDFHYFKLHGLVTFLIRDSINLQNDNPVRRKYFSLKKISRIIKSDKKDFEKLKLIEDIIDNIKP